MYLRGVLAKPVGPERDAEIARVRVITTEVELESSASFIREVMPALQTYASDYAKTVLKSIVLQGSDGEMRGLLDFTMADAEKWVSQSGVRAAGWEARQKWFQSVCDAFTLYQVATIGQLPGDVADGLAEGAEAIWKRDDVEAAPAA